jgi:hypothetical protein
MSEKTASLVHGSTRMTIGKIHNRLATAIIAVAAIVTPARAADSLPSAMLGTWCTQPDDSQGTPMKRCAPGAPDAINMRRDAMVSKDDRCRVVSVTTKSATRWVVSHVCDSRRDRRYDWTYFRVGTLYLAQVGTFAVIEEEKPRLHVSGCFTRTYDRAHLAKHPDQLVTSMRLHIVSDGSFALRVTKRGDDAVLEADGTCVAKLKGVLCSAGVAGSVRVSSSGRDRAVLLYLDDQIQMTAGHESGWLDRGKDDFVFRLDRAAERACKGM